jgi:AcrR family transcriptional regulator
VNVAVNARLDRREKQDRRDVLLDVAAAIVTRSGTDAVTMDAVAESAGVSRPLVYKHFANRAALLEELYAREANALHQAISHAVVDANSLEDMFRALVRGSLRAQAERGATFAALRAAGGYTDARRTERRKRNRATLRFFVDEAQRAYGMSEPQARAAVSIALAAIDGVLNVFRVKPTAEHAALLEDTYVTLVMSGLEGMRG